MPTTGGRPETRGLGHGHREGAPSSAPTASPAPCSTRSRSASSSPTSRSKGAPVTTKVSEDHVYFLTEGGKFALPIVPPPLQNHGNYVISLNQLVKWLAAQAEARGVDLLAGFPGAEVLYEGDARRRRAHRRQGHRQARAAEGQLRARRRPAREDHDPGRGRARQPDQAARRRG